MWERADPKRCFSVNANLLQGISESGLAVVEKIKKLQNTLLVKK